MLNNPFIQAINIKLAKAAQHIKLQLISIDGRIIREKEFYRVNQVQWRPEGISDGLYIIRASIDGKDFSAKAIKQ